MLQVGEAAFLTLVERLAQRPNRSFSRVVPDSQFSVLGIVLLAETARIKAIIDLDSNPVKVSDDLNEAQGVMSTSHLPPTGLKRLEDVGRLVQRPASSSQLSNPTTPKASLPSDVPLSQTTDRPVFRSLSTAEHKRPGKSPKTIDELFRALE